MPRAHRAPGYCSTPNSAVERLSPGLVRSTPRATMLPPSSLRCSSPCPGSASDVVGTWPLGGDPRQRAEAAAAARREGACGRRCPTSVLGALGFCGPARPSGRANVARRPLLGARQRLDAAQELRMLNEEAQLQQVEHLLDSLEPRQ